MNLSDAARVNAEYMTKFECVRVLGLRCQQINHDNTCAPTAKSSSSMAVAISELLQGQIHFIIRRELPGTCYDVDIRDLKLGEEIRLHLEHMKTLLT